VADDGEVTRPLNAPDPERTHEVKIPELAPPLRQLPPAPPADLAAHPGRPTGQNTAARGHTGDIGGDETQAISFDPET
jgi:hypothetical protein